jgi:predicted permease
VEKLIQDVRYALRMLAKTPAFTAIAVLTIALGIGANTAIFSVVKQVLLRPLGMKKPEQLVMLWPRNLARNIPRDQVSPGLYEDWRAQNHVFSEMADATDASYTLTGWGDPQSLVAWRLSANFMHVLGVEPMLGRMFTAQEEQPGHNHVVVLTYKIWQHKFGSDRDILGKTLTLNDEPYTVIGVMPRGFNFPGDVDDIWTPIAVPAGAAQSRNARGLRVVARIKDGVTLRQAQQDMEQLSQRLGQQYPDTDKGWDVGFQPVRDMFVGDIRTPLLALMGAVGFVLLIVCANVANLLLARAAGRRKEIAVRVTLGATRGRIVRQLLTESALLALFGCAVGVVLAVWSSGLLLRLFPNNIANLHIPRVEQIPVDTTVVGFSLLLTIVTSAIFGMAPALQVSATSPEADLREDSSRTTGSRGARRLRSALVVAQVSLALVLLVCAGLMVKSFARLQNAGLGLNPDHVLTMQVFLPRNRYKTDPDRSRFVQQSLQAIQNVPGVQSAAAVNFLPLSGFWGTLSFNTPNAAPAPVPQWPKADYRIASQDYFQTMQIPVLRGRGFGTQDTQQSPLVCVINAALAQRYFAGQDPIGKMLTPDPGGFGATPWLIVGVIGDVKHFGAAEAVHPEVYRPFTQDGFPLIAFTVRTGPEPMALADAVRKAIWSVDKDQAIFRVLSMDEAASESSALRRVSMIVFAFFAVTALVLAMLGIYGVLSYLVAQQTHEIGIRMALGATPGDVLRLIVGHGARMVFAGIGLGLLAAFTATRILNGLLYSVHALDPSIFAAMGFLLTVIALLACALPARRAAKVHPMEALRYE